MRYLISVFLFLSVTGCAHANERSTPLPDVCLPRNNDVPNLALNGVDVLVVLHQEFGLAVIRRCPVLAFSIDFSQSQLNNPRYASLRHHLIVNAMLGIASTEMRISGTIRRASGAEVRDTLVVTDILSYTFR
jgi:hypothetical protein